MKVAVKQRLRTDCGVAVLSYLAEVPWEEARDAIFGSPEKPRRSYRTKRADVARGLEKFGFEAAPLNLTRRWENFDLGRGFASVFLVSGDRRYKHWVAWERETRNGPVQIMDPWDGSFLDAFKIQTSGILLRSHFQIRPRGPRDEVFCL